MFLDKIRIDFELSISSLLTKEDTNTSGSYRMERPFMSLFAMAKYPNFYKYFDRLDTFDNWPTSKTPTKQQLAEAGFFYTQTKDHVLCFYCGLWLGDWEGSEDPWITHVFFMPDCIYLLEIKGQEYVNSFHIFEKDPSLRQTGTQLLVQDTKETLVYIGTKQSVIEENSGSNSGSSNIPSDIETILRNMSVEDKSVEDKSVEDKSIEDKSVEDKSIEDKSFEDKSNIAKLSHRETNSSSSTAESTTL